MGSTRARSRSTGNGVVTKTGWAALAVHSVTLPTGARVKVRFPNEALLLLDDAMPEDLRVTALRQLTQEVLQDSGRTAADLLTPEALQRMDDYYRFLTARALVDPQLTYEELAEGSPVRPPQEDLDFLVEILTRRRDTDAAGVTLGVERLDRFDRFRDEHGCDEDCEACEKVRGELSSVDVGAV